MNTVGYVEVVLRIQDSASEDAAVLTWDAYMSIPLTPGEVAARRLPDLVEPLVTSIVDAARRRLENGTGAE